MEEEIVLRGTTRYFEKTDPETSERLRDGELVFLNMPLPVGCNYKCLKCFSGGSDLYNRDLIARGLTTNFTESQRMSLISEANSLGAKTLVIGGAGEPLLHHLLDDVLDHAGSIGMNSVVFTNGLTLPEDRARHFFENGASIIFSYDSTNPDTYDILTGTKGNHMRARSNLEMALSISKKYSRTRNGVTVVPMAINTNLSKLTYDPKNGIDEVAKIHELINGDVAHYVSDITPTGNARDNWEVLVGTKDFSANPELRKVARKYSKHSGGSSRRQDNNCAYMYNGVVVYEGHFMMCPNFGLKYEFGEYPDVSVAKHFDDKKKVLRDGGNPSCITREQK